jgi:aminoglycoside phosphotransferase
MTAESALRELERLRPPTEDLVVGHGDYFFPNILVLHDEVWLDTW